MWRYIDDTFMIWPNNREELNSFLVALNFCHPASKCMPATSVSLIDYLDLTVYKDKDRQLHTDLFTNPTVTPHPRNYISFYPNSLKPRIIEALRKYPYRIFTNSIPTKLYLTIITKQTLEATQ